MIEHKIVTPPACNTEEDGSGVGVRLGGKLANEATRRLASLRDRDDHLRLGTAKKRREQQGKTLQPHFDRFTASVPETATVERIAEIATNELREVFGADSAGIVLVSEGGEVSYFGANEAGAWSARGVAPADAQSLPLAEVFQTGFPLWLLRGTHASRLFPETTELHRVIGCTPLMQGGRRTGALGMSYMTRPQDVRRECGLLQEYAACVALAVGHAEACTRARKERERADAERQRALFANRAKDELLSMLGHELRNPLSSVLAAAALLRRRAGRAFATELEIIERQTRHTARLVDDLIDASQLAGGEVELTLLPVEIGHVVAGAIEMARTALGARSHRLVTTETPSGLTVEADASRLSRAIASLLINAAKYTPEQGTICVEVRAQEARVEVSVRDNGVGIDAELLAHIFELFVQGPQAFHRPHGGLGVGLSTARNLVELHGGTLRAASEGPGKGSLFTLELPRLTTPSGDSSRSSLSPAAAEFGPRRVLLVDDNLDTLELVRQLLESEGYVVRSTGDAASALAIAAAFRPELALLDLGLPGMDGYELARRLRVLLKDDRPKLVAVTGYGSSTDRSRSAEAGFDGHILKPVDVATLLKLMLGLLAESGSGNAAVDSAGE